MKPWNLECVGNADRNHLVGTKPLNILVGFLLLGSYVGINLVAYCWIGLVSLNLTVGSGKHDSSI